MASAKKQKAGLKFNRYFTKEGVSPYDQYDYELRASVIRNTTGDAVFEMYNVEVPKEWSQVATDILAQKYFRKAGVPQADGSLGSETSIKQVAHRMADCWMQWGKEYRYFASAKDAGIFYDELVFMLVGQLAAPNSPQWFNTGLYSAYGIKGKPQGHYYVDPVTEELKKSTSAYERPQPHACFILSVDDDLVNAGGIMDLWTREARIFKYGSGVGTNYSKIRGEGEKLSGGGTSSGLMSFLKIGDAAAGAIKSGGTTRRAAKMVCLDLDHPEIETFIDWKVKEEDKVAALIAAGYSSDYEGEAYRTVTGQNSNNSVRISNKFFKALEEEKDWELIGRSNGKVMKTVNAKKLWEKIAYAAWRCADPGIQYDTTINEWHTCPKSGRINASNPCSEYMFLDNTACNLASINLRKFYDDDKLVFNVEAFENACRIWTVVLEISVLMAQFPSKEVAELSYEFRTLGLGFANLGSVLMVSGIPYDSDKARAIAGSISAIMTGISYKTSAEMAGTLGTFKGYDLNKEDMMRVMRNHRYAAYNASENYENLEIKPMGIDQALCPEYLLKAACNAWDGALQLGEQFGYRNAQSTVIAPTGTIGLLMDCDTTGVEPDFALVKFKKLSGGGYFKIINQSIPLALKNLGYKAQSVEDIVNYAKGTGTLKNAPSINYESLKLKGFAQAEVEHVDSIMAAAFDINFAFNVYTLGEATMERLGYSAEHYTEQGFNLLRALGFSKEEIEAANNHICGTMTIEGAPHLQEKHYSVFDCANKCGKTGERYIHQYGHVRMMGAVQPFISGAISKTINLPHEATVEDIEGCYMMSWQLGLKANALYRDGSKLSQPLSTKIDSKEEVETPKHVWTSEEVLEAARTIIMQSTDTIFKRQLSRVVERKKLPAKRDGFTQKSKIGGQTIFVRTGEYEDGTLGEIFIDMHKEGASYRSLLNCFAISVSIGLQYGVPLEEFADKFTFTRFEPSGPVDHANIKFSTSIVDYVFRLLGFEYLNRTDLVHVAPEDLSQYEKSTQDLSTEANGNYPVTEPIAESKAKKDQATRKATAEKYEIVDAAEAANRSLMGDAPPCPKCGHTTIRNGTCYKCLNCGESLGCS